MRAVTLIGLVILTVAVIALLAITFTHVTSWTDFAAGALCTSAGYGAGRLVTQLQLGRIRRDQL